MSGLSGKIDNVSEKSHHQEWLKEDFEQLKQDTSIQLHKLEGGILSFDHLTNNPDWILQVANHLRTVATSLVRNGTYKRKFSALKSIPWYKTFVQLVNDYLWKHNSKVDGVWWGSSELDVEGVQRLYNQTSADKDTRRITEDGDPWDDYLYAVQVLLSWDIPVNQMKEWENVYTTDGLNNLYQREKSEFDFENHAYMPDLPSMQHWPFSHIPGEDWKTDYEVAYDQYRCDIEQYSKNINEAKLAIMTEKYASVINGDWHGWESFEVWNKKDRNRRMLDGTAERAKNMAYIRSYYDSYKQNVTRWDLQFDTNCAQIISFAYLESAFATSPQADKGKGRRASKGLMQLTGQVHDQLVKDLKLKPPMQAWWWIANELANIWYSTNEVDRMAEDYSYRRWEIDDPRVNAIFGIAHLVPKQIQGDVAKNRNYYVRTFKRDKYTIVKATKKYIQSQTGKKIDEEKLNQIADALANWDQTLTDQYVLWIRYNGEKHNLQDWAQRRYTYALWSIYLSQNIFHSPVSTTE